ncbi:proteasome regulatory particle base subunit, partial [Cichlidogyrus casuarinus]
MYTAPEKPATKKDSNLLYYGPYLDKAPFSKALFSVQYEIKDTFLTVKHMTRLIEVSHWGNIAVEEDIEIHNTGPALKGQFSRFDYMQGIGHDKAAQSWNTLLPSSAKDIYYRDLIGNVSTSKVSKHYSAVQVNIVPRFPIFGGWRTRYTIGYNVPAQDFLFRDKSKFLLKMRVIDHIYDAQFVENFELKIILPEAISNIQLELPFAMKRLADSRMPTYMDITGREVITVTAKNLIGKHIQDFSLSYEFSMPLMLREFAMAIAAFMLLFISIIVYVRLDFSVSKKAESESLERTDALIAEALNQHEQRKMCYKRYETALNSYKVGKDFCKFTADCKVIDLDREAIFKATANTREHLRALYSEGAER